MQKRISDRTIGKRIRKAREYRFMSLKILALELGISYQQLQKYETGMNRVSARRLYDISRITNIPIEMFFVDTSFKNLLKDRDNDVIAYSAVSAEDFIKNDTWIYCDDTSADDNLLGEEAYNSPTTDVRNKLIAIRDSLDKVIICVE